MPRLAEAQAQAGADEIVNVADVARRRRLSAADRPDRLIGNDDIGRRVRIGVRQRAVELAADDVARLTGVALGALFADADDGGQTGALRRQALWRARAHRSRHDRGGARNGRRSPLRRRRRAAFRPRCRRYARPQRADGNPGRRWRRGVPPAALAKAGDQRRRRTHHDIDLGALCASARAPAMIFCNSPIEAESPFIFQLPATNGRRAIVSAQLNRANAMRQRGVSRAVAAGKEAF